MIILDTNVLSECLKPAPDARVMAWIAAHPSGSLFTTTVVEAETLLTQYRFFTEAGTMRLTNDQSFSAAPQRRIKTFIKIRHLSRTINQLKETTDESRQHTVKEKRGDHDN